MTAEIRAFTRASRQREVADEIERLVPHELVRPAKGVPHHAGLVERQRVLRRRPLNEPLAAQRLDFAHEAERPRAGELGRECVLVDDPAALLRADERMREVDGDLDIENRRGVRDVDGLAVHDAHAVREPELVGHAAMLDDARGAQRVEKRTRAPVEDRRLRRVHLDGDIVDARADDRREHVLDRVQPAFAVAELRASFGELRAGDVGRRLRVAGEVHATENDPLPDRRRHEGELAIEAEVQADARKLRAIANRAPLRHFSSRSSRRSIRFIIVLSLLSAALALSDSRCGRAG